MAKPDPGSKSLLTYLGIQVVIKQNSLKVGITAQTWKAYRKLVPQNWNQPQSWGLSHDEKHDYKVGTQLTT